MTEIFLAVLPGYICIEVTKFVILDRLNLSKDGRDQDVVRVRGHKDRLAALRGDAQAQLSRQGGLPRAAQTRVIQVSSQV